LSCGSFFTTSFTPILRLICTAPVFAELVHFVGVVRQPGARLIKCKSGENQV
jgi:hypothetical protein